LDDKRSDGGKPLYVDGPSASWETTKPQRRYLLVIVVTAAVVVAAGMVYLLAVRGPTCQGVASCFSDSVQHIVDGDTLDIGGIRVRLTLVDSADVGQPGYAKALQFTAEACPLGSRASWTRTMARPAGVTDAS
jgi:hypothetical protein